MKVIRIPYEWLESIFGTFVADNFNTIMAVVLIVGFTIKVLKGNSRYNKDWVSEAQERQNKRYEYSDSFMNQTKTQENWNEHYARHSDTPFKSYNGKWYTNGWVYNEETNRWDPPDYLSEESARKWKWDEEKQIWIDQDKLERQERYRKFREGKEPTYEEWKAARLKEQQKEEHPEE